VRLALVVIAAVIALTIAELTSEGFSEFTRDHALISTFIREAVLLVGVYLVIDEIIGRREARRWSDVTSLGIRALSALAHRPAELVEDPDSAELLNLLPDVVDSARSVAQAIVPVRGWLDAVGGKEDDSAAGQGGGDLIDVDFLVCQRRFSYH